MDTNFSANNPDNLLVTGPKVIAMTAKIKNNFLGNSLRKMPSEFELVRILLRRIKVVVRYNMKIIIGIENFIILKEIPITG
jgi:hypothetical protein